MNETSNSINWFEIPVFDLIRAKKFYESIFQISMNTMNMGGTLMGMFPSKPGSGKANGAIVQGESYDPSTFGCVIYLNANPNMDPVMQRVELAGGKILMPKMAIGENGFIAFIKDTEGNKIGIHSME